MLNRMPNEILVKILSKTKTATAKNCRLLNSQFNQVIERFELHKEEVEGLSISKRTDQSNLFEISIRKPFEITKQFETVEEFLAGLQHIVNQIGKVKVLKLIAIIITNELLDILLNAGCTRKILGLCINLCKFAPDAVQKWLSYFDCLRLTYELDMLGTPTILPLYNKMLTMDLVHLRLGESWPLSHVTDLSWIDDDLLTKCFTRGKYLFLRNSITGFTIGGIINFLKETVDKMQKNGTLDFGILKDHRAEDITEALDAVEAEYFTWDGMNYQYRDLMTKECPLTCGLCKAQCKDKVGPNGVSDCTQMASYSNKSQYYALMTTEGPVTCGRCPR